jgi:alpha-ketoglutarate-dependent taurine dioxygenase
MFWNNRCTLHRATMFDVERYDRLCYRVTVKSEPPY